MIYIYAACVLSLIGSFVSRNVKYRFNRQEHGFNTYELVAVLILDVIDLGLFSFVFVKLLDYMKGVAL